MLKKLVQFYQVIRQDIVTHISALVLAAGYFAQHGDALGHVIGNADLGTRIAYGCVLFGVFGLYATGVTPTSNIIDHIVNK